MAKLPDTVKFSIVRDQAQFEKDGFIGDCFLRECATDLMKSLNAETSGVVQWMQMIAFEVHREFAVRYLASLGLPTTH